MWIWTLNKNINKWICTLSNYIFTCLIITVRLLIKSKWIFNYSDLVHFKEYFSKSDKNISNRVPYNKILIIFSNKCLVLNALDSK